MMCKKEKSLVGLRIRHAVVDLIFRSPQRSVALPSASALARIHNISMSTVNRELKKLVEDGFIIGQKGVGMFTVPGIIKFGEKNLGRKIIGILHGDGRELFYDLMGWLMISECGLAIQPGIGHPRHISLISCHPDDIAAELKSQNLDELIAIAPSDSVQSALTILRRNEIPIVSIWAPVPGIPSILQDDGQAGQKMAELLAGHPGVKQILWMVFDDHCKNYLTGFRSHLNRAGRKIRIQRVANMGEFEAAIRNYVQQGKMPDGIFAQGETVYALNSILKNLGANFSGVLLAEGTCARKTPGFHGICYDRVNTAISQKCAECISAMFAGDTPQMEYVLPFEIFEL